MSRYTVSDDIYPLIKEFEGFEDTAYLDAVNVWSIGYGTTRYEDGRKVRKGDKITKEEALRLMKLQLQEHLDGALKCVDHNVELSQAQVNAIASFAYNVGVGAFCGSTMCKLINQGKFVEAAREFKRWNKADGRVLAGLTRRRAAEEELWLS